MKSTQMTHHPDGDANNFSTVSDELDGLRDDVDTLLDIAAGTVSVRTYGGSPSASAATNNAAFTAAFAAVASGGKVIIPEAGTYALSQTLLPPREIIIEGVGYLTVLDFSGQSSGPGISFTTLDNIVFRNFQLHNAHSQGFYAGSGGGSSGSGHTFDNVTARFCGGNGFEISDSYNLVFIGCDATGNTGCGFALAGYNTTVHMDQCEAASNTQSGYDLNNISYSTLTACGSDSNSQYGYALHNVAGITFNSSGCENNVLGGWLAQASTAVGSGKTVPDVHGIVMNGCFTTGNGTGGGASSFLECASSNSKVIDITLNNCYDFTSHNSISIIANGVTTLKKIGGTYAGAFNISGSATINALADTTPAADTVPYFDSVKTATTTALTSFGRSLIDDADAAAGRSTLSAEQIGTITGVNTQTSSYTLVLGDAGKVVEINNASANTLTIPPHTSIAFAVGTYVNFAQIGAGQTTVTPGSGVTLRSRSGLKTFGQYSMGVLYQRATDEWVVGGDMTS